MSDIIDSLVIDINAKSQSANDAIDRLVGKLDRLSTSLTKINGTNLSGLANGVQKLGTAMQTMNNVKTTDFTRLATNLTKLGNVNTQALNTMASSMSHLTRAFNNLGTVSSNAQQVGELANNLSQLGSARMQRAIVSIPQLATAMHNLMATLSTAPRVSRNVIDMANAMANLSAQGSHVSTASRHMVSGLNRTSASANRASKSYKGLASSIGKFYATYFAVIRGLKGLWQSIESTADYIEAYNYFNVALGKIGSDWSEQFEQYGYENAEAYAESFSKRLSEGLRDLSGVEIQIGADGKGILSATGMKNLGLNIQEVTQYASQLASVTNSVGQTGEVSLAAAESLTKLGADISSLFNIDFSQAMKNLQSGLIGQSRSLYKFGIDITAATLQTYAYELGIEKAVSEMTQAEKMQLRMIAILRQSKVAWGDLANTISSPSNMMRQFTNNLKETGIVLGQLFVPLLQKVLPVINGATIAIKRLLVNIAGFLGIKLDLDSFGQGYNDMGEDIDGAVDSMDDLTEATKKAKGALRGFDELKVINTSDTGAIKGMEDTLDLTDEILAATSEYEKVWDEAFGKMENKAEQFADKFELFFEPFAKLFESLMNFNSPAWEGFTGFFDNLGDAAWPVIKGGLGAISDFIDDIDPSTAEAIGSAMGAIATALVTIAGIKGVKTLLTGIFKGLVSHPIVTIATAMAGIAGALSSLEKSELDKWEVNVFGETFEDKLTRYATQIEDTKTNLEEWKSNLEDIDENTADLQALAGTYFDLASKEELSAYEVAKLKGATEQLINKLPGFKDIINDETKSFNEQKTAVSELIAEQQKLYKTQAAKGQLEGVYSEAFEKIEQAKQIQSDLLAISEEILKKQQDIREAEQMETMGTSADWSAPLKAQLKDLEKTQETLMQQYDETLSTIGATSDYADYLGEIVYGVEGFGNDIDDMLNSVTDDWNKTIQDKMQGIEKEFTSAFGGISNEVDKELDKGLGAISKNLGTWATTLSKQASSTAEEIAKAFNDSLYGNLGIVSDLNDLHITFPSYEATSSKDLMPSSLGVYNRVSGNNYRNANYSNDIESAAYNGMRRALSENVGANTSVNITLQGDAGDIFRVVQNSANDYQNRTGNPAFGY